MLRLLGLCALLLCAGCTAAPAAAPVSTVSPPTVAVSTATAVPTIAPTVAVVLPVNVPRAATVEPRAVPTVDETNADRATRLEGIYPVIDPRQIAAQPAFFLGQKAHVRGLMLEVTTGATRTRVRLMAQITSDMEGSQPMLVDAPLDPPLLQGACRSFYGTVEGEESGVPLVRAVDSLPRARC